MTFLFQFFPSNFPSSSNNNILECRMIYYYAEVCSTVVWPQRCRRVESLDDVWKRSPKMLTYPSVFSIPGLVLCCRNTKSCIRPICHENEFGVTTNPHRFLIFDFETVTKPWGGSQSKRRVYLRRSLVQNRSSHFDRSAFFLEILQLGCSSSMKLIIGILTYRLKWYAAVHVNLNRGRAAISSAPRFAYFVSLFY